MTLDQQSATGRGAARTRCANRGADAAPAAGRGTGAGGGGGRGGPAVPYWGKYVYHDNNRDINLSQVSMRAITDWYFTAHPPIMHDLHESLPLLYTYSGGPPQNPNLDPILFAELPFFSNFELSQMTKWGMPGVYTHAFMDGWSPGYLGSVAYNHNGMMRMYETQSGREGGPGAGVRPPRAAAGDGAAAAGSRRGRRVATRCVAAGRGVAGAEARSAVKAAATVADAASDRRGWRERLAARSRRGRAADRTRRRPAARVVSRHPDPAGRGEQLHAPQQHELHADRRALGAAAHVDVPEPRPRELLPEDAELDRGRARTTAPYGYVIPVQRDMTRVAELVQHPARAAASRSASAIGRDQDRRRDVPGRLVRHQARPAVRAPREEPAREAELPRSERSRTYDDSGWTMGWRVRRGREGDQGQGDPRRADDAGERGRR